MQDSFLALSAAKQSAGAAVIGLPLFTYCVRAAHRAMARHGELKRFSQPLFCQHTDHFRDHIASPAHDHGIAHPHVLAAGLVFVVQGRIGHGDAAHKHRRQLGHRREFSSTSDLHINRQHCGQLLLGRIFVRHRPAWFAGHKAQLALQGQAVDLVDHAINVIWKCVPLLADGRVKCY